MAMSGNGMSWAGVGDMPSTTGGNGMFGGMNMSNFAGILQGLFGNSGGPFADAMKQYQQYGSKAEGVQNPFLQAGYSGLNNYQNWLNGMQDPAKFINGLTNQYQASPWSKFLQDQSMRAGTNAASASGLTGSSPMIQQMQQNSSNIASGGMQDWLSHVLGINTQYGAGEADLMHQGANSANTLTGMYGDMGRQMGEAAYGQGAANNNDFMSMLMSALQMAAA